VTERATKIATRGSGAGRPGSKRSPEELREDFTKAETGPVARLRYAEMRRDQWLDNVAKAEALVDKYRRLLDSAGISVDEVTEMVTKATEEFNIAVNEKAADKEAKKAEKAEAKKDAAPATA